MFRRKQKASQEQENQQQPASEQPAMPAEFEQVVKVLPERDRDGTYFWQRFAERLHHRFDGVPGRNGTGSFVNECLRAGADAVPVIRRNTLWEKNAPDTSRKRARAIYELRVRLGLFYAASLHCLVEGASRLCARCGDTEWHGFTDDGQPFSEFVAAQEGKVEITWTNGAPDYGKACLIKHVFLEAEEMLLLTGELAQEVYNNAAPSGPRGLFALMLAAAGQGEKESVDIARVFLRALGDAVEQKAVKVNTKMGGHVFITPEFWLLTTPIGLNCVNDYIRTRRGYRRHDFTRHEVFRSLREGGFLVGAQELEDTPRCVLKSRRWRKPLELRGLCIAAGVLFSVPGTPFFEGTVRIREGLDVQ